MFQTNVVEKIKMRILCSINFFPLKSCRYKIMWKNTAELGKPQMTIWCMCIACWMP